MKNFKHSVLLAFAIFLTFGSMQAQSNKLHKSDALMQPAPNARMFETPASSGENATDNGTAIETRGTEQEVLIGQSVYDLQTNYSVCNRISRDAAGNIMGVWTQGFISGDGYSDRGTGYNRYDAGSGSWMAPPTARLESSVRTGWPNHVITDSGTEFIVNHVFGNPEYMCHYLRREAGELDWTEGDIPTDTPFGALWPRAAVSGETIHVIAVSTPEANGGIAYEGVNVHPLYYRSQDGGETWDVTDFIIPGLDSSFMVSLYAADSYSIDAQGDKVAVGIFGQFNDAKVYISEDGGDTWTNETINDFPLDKFVVDQGYTIDDLPPYDPDQPDTLAILTTDNSGTVLIDNAGNVHAWYGEMYVLDSDLTDGNTSYFPGTDGLAYWNESMGFDGAVTIVGAPDLNGNDSLDIVDANQIAIYFMSLSSMPSAGVDENDNLYMAYSAVMEGPEYLDADDDQHMRHIFVVKSEDGGATWGEPYDAINATTIGDPLFVPFVEAVFPHVLRDVAPNGDVSFIYQQDFQPGLALRGDMDLPGDNNIVFSQINQIEDPVSIEAIQIAAKYNFELFPNPAVDQATIQFELPSDAPVRLDLFDGTGRMLKVISSQNYSAGVQQETIDINQLPTGMYFVRMMVGPQSTVKKLMVE